MVVGLDVFLIYHDDIKDTWIVKNFQHFPEYLNVLEKFALLLYCLSLIIIFNYKNNFIFFLIKLYL